MEEHSSSSKSRMKRKKHGSGSSPSFSSAYSSSDSDDHQLSSPKRHRKHTHGDKKKHRDERRQRRREKEKSRERRKSGERRERERRKRHRSRRREAKHDFSDSGSDSEYWSELEAERLEDISPEAVVRDILKQFPGAAADLEQLLQMIDNGQAVNIRGLSERSLIKHLRKLFLSLDLKESGKHIFLLPPNVQPTLELAGPLIRGCNNDLQSAPPEIESKEGIPNNNSTTLCPDEGAAVPRRRVIGPEMPSAELLAAAAKLTKAEAELREAELDEDNEVFIGPPPPAVVTEAESANEAERFEEVTRILGAEVGSPYDVLGVNRNMLAENIKKRYWKLSLMVHPDKCSHPQAHQAFIKLNKSFKDLQDPDKRKTLDEKIKQEEEQEEFKAELQAMREAAQWRHLQGISMEGDDVILAEMDVKVGPKRDEWMTTLPPERKPGMTMQSTRFSRTAKEGRGDTSVWTDTPSDKAQKAKMNYLEAYNEAADLASSEQETKRKNSDADFVDHYNKEKRSKSLVEKHQEAAQSRLKKKAKLEPVKEEWEGKHPWKPWDREKDLTAGQKGFNFNTDNMSQGLSSRFSSGSFQRNFL